MSRVGAGVLVFCTSAAVLVLEILAGRLLAPYVGVSLETYTGVIGTVLAGIALGTATGGRLADQRDPTTMLGPTLVLGGLLALASLPVIRVLGPGVSGGGPTAVVILAVAGFFLPAAVLSAVSPMAAKLGLASLAETGTVVGGLSAAGTAGALVGTFITGFVLVAALPSTPIVVGLGSALVVAGLSLGLRLGGRRPGPAMVCTIVAVAGLSAVVPSPCEHETAYYCASVEVDPARPSGRILMLDTLRHSYVDLDDPTYLEFRYTRLFADVVGSVLGRERLDALHLGGGGFTVPRWLAATRRGSTSRVLELDPDLVAIVEDELALAEVPALSVRVGDARTALDDEPTGAYDMAVVDVFGGLSVPWHLTTDTVAAELRRTLRPGGVVLANVIDGGPRSFARAYVATLAATFDHVAVVAPPDEGPGPLPAANLVVVVSDRPLDDVAVDGADGVVVDTDAFIDGADVLTDDHAPVDQLLTPR